MTTRRVTRRPPPKKSSRARGIAIVGVIALLLVGITFVAGAATRRWWWPVQEKPWAVTSGWKQWLGIAPRKSAGEAVAKEKRTEPAPPAGPVLTFYHELTAPLVPAPPPPRPKPGGGPVVVPVAPSTSAGPATLSPDREGAAPSGRFTVQVGAYRTREGAESLRSKLAGVGFEVYIVESTLPDGVRYRVQVGSFPTAEEARAAAAKLAGTRQVATYVTTR